MGLKNTGSGLYIATACSAPISIMCAANQMANSKYTSMLYYKKGDFLVQRDVAFNKFPYLPIPRVKR